jgi:hypothetical protein
MRYDDPVIMGLIADRLNQELFMLPEDIRCNEELNGRS